MAIGIGIGLPFRRVQNRIPYESDLLYNYANIGFDTYTPSTITSTSLTNIDYYYRTDITEDSINGNYVLAFRDSEVLLSDDAGVTYKYRNCFWGKRIDVSKVFNDGSVLFGTSDAIFYANNQLVAINQSSILNLAGQPYSPVYRKAGNYRQIIPSDKSVVNGIDLFTWVSYVNVSESAAPTNVYATIDKGATVKITYQFGQNSNYENLGNPDNPLTVRHGHVINFNSANSKFYMQTGDGLTVVDDCRWLEGVYNSTNDTWTWTQVANGGAASVFKSAGLAFYGNDLYVGSDTTGDNAKWNILKGDYSDIANTSKYTRIYVGTQVVSSMKDLGSGVMVQGTSASRVITLTKNQGTSYLTDTITDAQFPAGKTFIGFSDKRSDNYFLAHYTDSSIIFRRNNPIWIKIK